MMNPNLNSVTLATPRRSRLTFEIFGVCAIAVGIIFSGQAFATTKGLSQIVTPDLQPLGDLSLSFQWQAEQIGNPYEVQAELGITKFFELAMFDRFKPAHTIFATAFSLLNK